MHPPRQLLPRRAGPRAAVALVVLVLSACSVAPPRDGRADADGDRGLAAPRTVGCGEMLTFVGVDEALPGSPECRRSDGIDTFYAAELSASPDEVAAWLTALDPGAVLGDVCGAGVDRCVQVRRDPDGPGDAHFVDVRVSGTGPDAAVSVAAYTT